ncbi:hypothetical protein CSC2_03610 [Clostridium zeae]|uniref:Uncharacterized protein n=1 Tax=Clostridium zeae TaxID=2759022 RepID=A0ABQ1E512_9CLOT|nr:hypothetical protein CSC2_03610 [Clostridium zeae]
MFARLLYKYKFNLQYAFYYEIVYIGALRKLNLYLFKNHAPMTFSMYKLIVEVESYIIIK